MLLPCVLGGWWRRNTKAHAETLKEKWSAFPWREDKFRSSLTVKREFGHIRTRIMQRDHVLNTCGLKRKSRDKTEKRFVIIYRKMLTRRRFNWNFCWNGHEPWLRWQDFLDRDFNFPKVTHLGTSSWTVMLFGTDFKTNQPQVMLGRPVDNNASSKDLGLSLLFQYAKIKTNPR